MATFVIGDIHGNSAALNEVLSQLAGEVSADDTAVFLGDYIDRGPDTKACIDEILEFQSSSPVRVVTLLGNHEDWLLRSMRDPTRHSWLLGMEAFETIASYSPEAARELRLAVEEAGPKLLTESIELPYHLFFGRIPQNHIAFLEALAPYHSTADAICVHGGLDPRVSILEQQPLDALLWGTHDFVDLYEGAETVVYGHWSNAILDTDGWPRPRVRNRTVGIDTISHGVLTALRLPDGRLFQSRPHRGPKVAV